ncbi:MAG: efflux RND transporter periplasmic adaptor subunit [Proteobacteria bacterium]|nr:efflux RND transporter periplasmic adaptor subunit [Pseudomonadota bacterium]
MNVPNSLSRVALVFMVLALLAGCDNAADADNTSPVGNEQSSELEEVVAVQLVAQPYTSRIQATGKAQPVRESLLSSEVSGTIDKIFVKAGDRVKKGDVLLRFDQKGFYLEVQHAKAALAAAKTQVNQLELEVNRISGLVGQEAATVASLDQLRAQYNGALAQEQMAAVAVRMAQKQLGDSVLRAPYNGMISEILHEEGEFCPSMPQTMLIEIVDTSSLEVQVYLPEAVSGDVEVGHTAEVEVESAGVTTTGEVIFVSNRLRSDSQTLEIKIKLDNENGKIKGGAFTRINMIRRAMRDAILVPLKSVQRGDDGKPYVFIAVEGKVQKVQVLVGEASGNNVLVLDGLAAGQWVVVSGVADLEDGVQVTVKAEQD